MTIDFGPNMKSRLIMLSNGSSVFDVLNESTIVEFKEFAGLGKMITAIDHTSQNSTHYWFYYVGDKFAQVAADKYILYENSSVLFKLSGENKFNE